MTANCIERDWFEPPCERAAAGAAASSECCRDPLRGRRSMTLRSALRRLAHAASTRFIEPIAERVRERRLRMARQHLLELDDRLLEDIGLTRDDVFRLTGVDPRPHKKRVGGGHVWLHDIHLDR